jgi:serine/threonine protein kinase
MAASFKIPTSLKRKAKWKLFEKENKLGCGTFGSVYLAKYKGKTRKSGCQKQ